MSLIAQAVQIGCVAALEEAQISFKVFDSLVDPRDLRAEPQVIAVVSVTEGRFRPTGKALLSPDQNVIDLCIDFAIARKVEIEVEDGAGPDAVTITVEFPDNGSGHDMVLRTCAYEAFAALQARNGPWAEIFREAITGADPDSSSTWERGVSADKGVRLGILRYTLKLSVLDDPTPGEPLEAGTFWPRALALMEADPGLADKAKLWRKLIAGNPALPEWRTVQAALGLTTEAMQGSGIAPLPGSTETADAGPTAATEITVDADDGGPTVVVGDDEAALIEDETETPLVELDEDD